MKRLFTFILVLMVMAVLAAPVAANNGNGNGRGNGDGGGTVWNKKKCEDAGGVWSNNRGEKTCYLVQAVDVEIPDTAWGDPEVDWENVLAYYRLDPENREGATRIIVLVVDYEITQLGNVGAPGTRSTFDWWTPECSYLGVQPGTADDLCHTIVPPPVL
ncbi:MAG: hypothetical protein EA415_11755 [Sphaerobacteraceae bacterium]|nr:MAG: hypothetical protein EA415_11755 [Sphaerobacteraceae bacterium]